MIVFLNGLKQVLELRQFLKSKGAEISEEADEGGLVQDLAAIIQAMDVVWKEDEKDVESVMNSVISLLLILDPGKQEELVQSLSEKLSKTKEAAHACLRLQLLSNLFHGIEGNTVVRYAVYCSLIHLASSCGAIQQIPTELEQVRKWMSEWKLTMEQKQQLLRLLYESLVDMKKRPSKIFLSEKAEQFEAKLYSDKASKVMVELLGSYTEENASQARDDAHRCIVRALRDPTTFLFDHLVVLKPVRFLEGELIHDLLTIFVSGRLSSYMKFYSANKDFVESLGLSHQLNVSKLRLLTFMGMAVESTEIAFGTIQEELQIEEAEVEAFVIDAVRTKMVHCKIDQLQRKVIVTCSTHRTFGRQQWQQLYDCLVSWNQNLTQIRTSLLSISNS
uniref:Eukaryotic translation initiation factor 3 subunit M n=1 Tax=Eptatretus burgeri TaxID=7764 RepID=A0A8C4N0W8_EPTBU